VEVTELRGGFLKAWQTGAKGWHEASAARQRGFYPTQAAWKEFETVGLPDEGAKGAALVLPPSERILNAYLQELLRFVDRELVPQIGQIQAQIGQVGSTPRLLNRLGVLYARYGKDADARASFEKALARDRSYVPALINLGNMLYLGATCRRRKPATTGRTAWNRRTPRLSWPWPGSTTIWGSMTWSRDCTRN